ncbi:MAG: tetratricopeptide repeat protein [Candidatus Omnitrophica bacterium]|nr:tetratricopeptide repeat protein [Candidatus Omnitrophota bacterium]
MLTYSKRLFPAFAACLVILVLGVMAVYQQTFQFNFVFDDRQFIVENTILRSWNGIFYFFTNDLPINRFITLSSFALNYQMYGLNPQGFHIFNVLIHLAVVCSVWWLFRILLVHSAKDTSETNDRLNWLAFFGALLFALHPAQTQAVSYISQRFSSLAALFYILTVGSYLRLRQSQGQKNCLGLTLVFALSFVLAILSKEEAVTLPLMIITVELFFFRNQAQALPRHFWLKIILGFGLFVLLFTKLFRSDLLSMFSINAPSESHDGDILTGSTYLLTQARVFLTFLRLLVWPFPQTIDYDYPASFSLLDPGVLLGLAVFSGSLFTAWRFKKSSPLLAFGILWLLITFTANLIPRVNLLWEQKVYLLSAGFLLALIVWLNEHIRSTRILFCVLSVLVVLAGAVTFQRNKVWRNDLTLWTDALAKAPHKSRTLLNAGDANIRYGYPERGLKLFQQAKALYPRDPFVARAMGSYYFNRGEFRNAASEYANAVRLEPAHLDTNHYLALSFEHSGNHAQALKVYDQALTVNKNNARLYAWRAGVFIKTARYEKAWQDLLTSLGLAPRNLDALISLIEFYKAQKRLAELEELLARGAEDYPTSEQIFLLRASYYQTRGNFAQAKRDIRQALRLNPHNPQAAEFYFRYLHNAGLKDQNTPSK